ncbi:D-alanyl-D-alanine carboxypeptidase family protein [Streptomyces sp. NPDC050610]|uniref:D-alanyl-D-alanine carboxypeptidase family protein n=1 Tax=Streptomyces sp. NPDC050610 TaxID=3157097 RepID=UPI003445490F
MHRTPLSARTRNRRIRWLVAIGLAFVTAVTAAALGFHTLKSSSTSASLSALSSSAAAQRAPRGEHRGVPGEADGVVPDDVTVFDDRVPAVANLDPGLLKALRRAAAAAGGDGFYVNSGWRSPEYQNQLLREAVAKYGSEDEAARWVATAATSPHVSGDAVDVGHSRATEWLSRHGAEYGLCQIYRNEPWHYELRPEASTHGCPRMYADPTRDPRMRP